MFLSLHGSDDRFVSAVHERLPGGMAYFYRKSFVTGENLVAAMEERVEDASIFALFASRAGSDSPWVDFEIDRARLAAIKHRKHRILVFPTDAEMSHANLPAWLREHWVPNAGSTPRDVARYIRDVLATPPFANWRSAEVVGRGPLLDIVSKLYRKAAHEGEHAPNVFLFFGIDGVGRRTVAREFFQRVLKSLPDLAKGPVLLIPQFADAADLYRALRQEIESSFSLHSFEPALEAFRKAGSEEQAAEIVRSLKHFGDLGQAVTVVTGNGIFEERGTLKPWAHGLFRALAERPSERLCLVTGRDMYETERSPHPNVLQFQVSALEDDDVVTLMRAEAEDGGRKIALPKQSIIHAIGGHALIARATARLVMRDGPAVLNDDPRALFIQQDRILGHCLDYDRLDAVEKDVLSLLSWVPRLDSGLLRTCLVDGRRVPPEEFSQTLSRLSQRCLIINSDANYAIASPIRALFRRKHGHGSADLLAVFAALLRREWVDAKVEGRTSTELLDALVYMTALEGGTLAPEFRGLVLPATIQEVVAATYRNREGQETAALESVVRWGSLVRTMPMDETVREEILSYVARAQTRLGDPDAEGTLRQIDDKHYRSRHYLRAFHIRKTGGNLDEALSLLLQARKVRKYRHMVIDEICRCYYRLGRVEDLQKVLDEEQDLVEKDPVLLDYQAAIHIGASRFPEAEAIINRLRGLEREDGRADCRQALVIMHRDRDYCRAQDIMTDVMQRARGGLLAKRSLRAIAAAHAGDSRTARSDIEHLRGHLGGLENVHRIQARILLQQKHYDNALGELGRIGRPTRQDSLLRAWILNSKAEDPNTNMVVATKARDEALILRKKHKGISEFDPG